ncbi:MAG: helix-turn-helix domain-containing protein [Myxococcales bacterium]
MQFIEAASQPGANISQLCREHGVSRQTGHKWLKRFHDRGYRGLGEESRRPKSSPRNDERASGEGGAADARQASELGAKKAAIVLGRDLGDDGPREATIARLLKSAGKVRRRRPKPHDDRTCKPRHDSSEPERGV